MNNHYKAEEYNDDSRNRHRCDEHICQLSSFKCFIPHVLHCSDHEFDRDGD